ncbi:MAG: thioredoxin domain-containing protein [Anaerolineae bacterium]|jgi:protein-disulfide isomerase
MLTLPKLIEAFVNRGQVRYQFKDFPLPSHANAQKAAEAARCAGAQGAYWPMHARLFEEQNAWSGQPGAEALDLFVRYAVDLGLDAVAFRQCIESGQFGPQVGADLQEGQQAGVRGTPSFLINGQLLAGAHPFEMFEQVIEAELKKAR